MIALLWNQPRRARSLMVWERFQACTQWKIPPFLQTDMIRIEEHAYHTGVFKARRC